MENDELLANVTEVAGSKVLPPCVIYGRLGRGGMGAVYRARHLNLAIDVAVKVLKPSLVADDPSYVSRFKREGQSAAAIRHQNVIGVFDVAEHAGLHYIIMELVVGQTARQRVERKGPLPVDQALQILYEAAQGLAAAHALGIVHRDVKPDNLLISNTGQVKVADLGLAKPTMGTGGASLMSAANAVMGTPSYMPPEQWESPTVGPAADVWALGTTAWFLLTGADAFDSRDGNYPRVMRQILLQPFPDLKQKRADVGDAVLAVLAKATAKEPAQRYADCNEFAAALEELGLERVSLRETAEATEAKTMVSPGPKDLDKIKQWLREDFATRMQSGPRSGLGNPPTSGSGGTGLASPPLVGTATPGGTIVQPPPKGPMPMEPAGRKVRWIAIGAAVAILGGSAAAWALLNEPPSPGPDEPDRNATARTDQPPPGPQPPQPQAEGPVAIATRLAAGGQLDEAIKTLRDVPAAQRDEPVRKQLAGLLGRRASVQEQDQDFRTALQTLQEAVGLDPDPVLQTQQTELRERAQQVAKDKLQREAPRPETPVKLGAVEFRGALPFPAVRQLMLGETSFELPPTGVFMQTLQLAQRVNGVPLLARLVDDHQVDLGQWPVRFETEPDTLPCEAELDDTDLVRAEGLLFTIATVVVVRGELPEDAQLLVNGERVQPRRAAGSTFTVEVPTVEGDAVPIEVLARKQGFPDVKFELGTVVRLRNNRDITPRQPVDGARVDAFRTRVEITTDRWTRKMVAVVGDERFALAPVADAKPPAFAGDVELVPGPVAMTIVATNAAGRDNSERLAFECTASAPTFSSVALVRGDAGQPRALARGERVYVDAAAASLRVAVTGTEPRLSLGGAALEPPKLPADVPLLGLVEGTPKTFELRVENPLAADTWRVEVVLDTTKPRAAVTAPAAGERVPPNQPLTLRGTWQDDGGCAGVTAGGKEATVGRDGTWSVTFGLPAAQVIPIVVRDNAGNELTFDYAIEVELAPVVEPQPPQPNTTPDPPPNTTPVVAKTFAGFRNAAGTPVNSAGYPKVIVDETTSIELVAVAFPDNAMPRLYVGVKPVTERQYDGDGDDVPELTVRGKDIPRWLPKFGGRFDLLLPSEWEACKDNPALENRTGSPYEWLKPDSWYDNTYPICKAPSAKSYSATSSGTLGFRVCYRPR